MKSFVTASAMLLAAGAGHGRIHPAAPDTLDDGATWATLFDGSYLPKR